MLTRYKIRTKWATFVCAQLDAMWHERRVRVWRPIYVVIVTTGMVANYTSYDALWPVITLITSIIYSLLIPYEAGILIGYYVLKREGLLPVLRQ